MASIGAFSLLIIFFFLTQTSSVYSQLKVNFYERSCPNLTRIVKYGVWLAVRNETRMAASLLRLHSHDCFVNGCEGSVLLDETSEFKGEKNALPNRNSARGFEVIDNIKANVERACPSTVSCTDILTLAAREAVLVMGGPYWALPLGRRDGKTASESDANAQIPSPFEPLPNITAKFTSKGMTAKDVVVLSGAHTIGFARCPTFKRRLFDFQETGKPDPSLDSSLLQDLQSICPEGSESDSKLAALDPVSKNKFDNEYYKNLINNSGVLESDQALMGDSDASSLVTYYSNYPYSFRRDFGVSMVKMANVGVLTGEEGEIRKNCRLVNNN